MSAVETAPALSGHELSRLATDALERATSGHSGPWRRAAAVLGRQSIEQSIATLWAGRSPAMAETSMRAQLIALPHFLAHPVAHRSTWAWSALSDFCHHRVYELPPALPTLTACIRHTCELADAVAKAQAGSARTRTEEVP